ncbi:MAG: hypothetical protein FWH28_00190 [Clostridiales bacterium]|nr:hypothetical protein [Clostridiales bacterium]
MKRNTIFLSTICILLLAFLVTQSIVNQRNASITLSILSYEMKFSIGQTQDEILEEFLNNHFACKAIEDNRYKNTDNLNHISIDERYIFVFYKNKLARIDIRDSDGVGVVLPRNYYD